MKIGFDLDQVFINYPPIVPPKLINFLYRNHCKKELSYRIPNSALEKMIRRMTHLSILRPAIKQNVHFLRNFPNNPHTHQLFLISSRYKFLENLTYQLLKRDYLYSCFNSIYLNTKNSQPHLFKEKVIKKLKLDLYVDDDLDLLKYLQKSCPVTKLFWYNRKGKINFVDHIIEINNLDEIKKYLK